VSFVGVVPTEKTNKKRQLQPSQAVSEEMLYVHVIDLKSLTNNKMKWRMM
jgi:hypothetical protein